jgi:hypothetical protein
LRLTIWLEGMGNLAPEALIKELNLNTALPVISAGA